jgi:hypothetical protein
MAIYLDYSKPEYPEGKSFYIKQYSKNIIENIPENEQFHIFDIPVLLHFYKEDTDRFLPIQNEIKKYLIKEGFIELKYKNTGLLHLVIGAKERFKELENSTPKTINSQNIVTNIYHGTAISNSTITDSQIFQESRFEKSDISKTITSAPNPNDKKHNPIVSFILKFWWTIVIPIIVGIILIYSEILIKK